MDKDRTGDTTWVTGGREEDNRRYREFLEYCEEKRQESKRMKEEDEARKTEAKKKEESWALMRMSVEYLKQNEDRWRCRKIDECERIKEEEKKDRLAIGMASKNYQRRKIGD